MKKLIGLLAMILALTVLVGCTWGRTTPMDIDVPGRTLGEPRLPSPTRGDTNATGPFDVLVQHRNGFGLGFVLRNNSDEIFFYSDAYRLYVYADTWLLHHENAGSGAEYYLRPGAMRDIHVQWSRGFGGQIEPGRYRLVMETLDIEFEQLHWSDEENLAAQGAVWRQARIDFVAAGEPAPGAVVSDVVATPAGMTFTLRNESSAGFFYGYAFDVARYEDGGWMPVPFIIDNAGWILLGFLLDAGESRDYAIDWAWMFGELAPGRYMFVRDLSLTSEPFVQSDGEHESWSDIHIRYPTQVHLVIEFEVE